MRLLIALLLAVGAVAQVPMPYDGTRLMPRLSWLGNHVAIPGHGLVGLWDLTGWDAATQSIPNFAPGQTAALQLGSTAGADANDPTPSQQGMVLATNDYLAAPVLPYGANAGTVIAVHKAAQLASVENYIFSHFSPTARVYIRADRDGAAYKIGVAGSSSITTGQTCDIGQWQFVAMTYSEGTWRFYKNAGLPTSGTYTGIVSGISNSYVGAIDTGTGAASFWNGPLSHILVYSRALTDAEIAAAYRWLKTYWAPAKGITLP